MDLLNDYQFLSDLLRRAFAPVFAMTQPEKRLFGTAAVTAVLMALWHLRSHHPKISDRLRYIFAKDLWFHPSTRLDATLWWFNSLLRIGRIFGVLIPSTSLAIGLAAILEYVGGPRRLEIPPIVIGFLFAFVSFVADDWSRFFLHRWMHRSRFLWSFHRVHHSAEVLTPIALYRTHPVESLLYGIRGTIILGGLSGIFLYFFREQLSAWDIMGVNAFGLIFNHLGANLRHSHIPLSFGRWEKWILSPAQHQIHHSLATKHHDKNFGSCFAIWDRIGGSFYLGDEAKEGLQYGFSKQPHPTVWQALIEPFVYACRRKEKKKVAPRPAQVLDGSL